MFIRTRQWRIATDKSKLPAYKYEGITLTPTIAKGVLIELYEGKRYARADAVELVVDTHLERGGAPPNEDATSVIKKH